MTGYAKMPLMENQIQIGQREAKELDLGSSSILELFTKLKPYESNIDPRVVVHCQKCSKESHWNFRMGKKLILHLTIFHLLVA